MPTGIYIRIKKRKHSEETKKKMSESQTGKKHSEESKKKMSEAHKGNKSFWGKRHSEVARKKMSEAHKGVKLSKERVETVRERMKGNTYTLGKKRSEEVKKKMSEAQKGERSHFWKGGITPLTYHIRHCFNYRQWRSDIFTRDDFICVLCDKRGGWLEADHYPKRFSDIFRSNKIKTFEEALECEEFWNINNGRTLCQKCHNKNKWRF